MEGSTNQTREKAITQVGLRYTVFAVAVIAIEFLVSIGLNAFAPEIVEKYEVFLNFLLIIVAVDVVGFPLIWQLSKKLPAVTLPQSDLGAGKFTQGIFICAGICGVGTVIGTIVHIGVSVLLGGDGLSNNNLAALMMNSGTFMRILTVGILAPVFEELIFRKILVDHLVKYGKWLAIAASGMMFGLFHGNFSQFFYAAGLGFFFAYIYVKTGKIRYTIAYHMIINLSSSAVTVPLSAKYMAALEAVGIDQVAAGSPDAVMQALPAMLLYLGWLAILGICGLVGLILLCVNLKNFKLQEEEGNPAFGKALKEIIANPGMLAFAAACLVIFIYTYLPGQKGAACRFYYQSEITVEDGTIILDGESGVMSREMPLPLEKDADYQAHIAWNTYMDGEEDMPGFLTVLLIKDAQGEILTYLSGSGGDWELDMGMLKAGEYTVEYRYYIEEGEFREMLSTLSEDVSDEVEGSFEGYDHFGDEGTWTIQHTFEIEE